MLGLCLVRYNRMPSVKFTQRYYYVIVLTNVCNIITYGWNTVTNVAVIVRMNKWKLMTIFVMLYRNQVLH